MGSQGFGNLPPGSAPFGPKPQSPRGLYRTFGAPERLLRIHFPNRDPNSNPSIANPWYWWFDLQQPQAFSFLFTKWVRLPDFPVIKILQIDTQPLVPIPKVGHVTLVDAVRNPQQADKSFGRIDPRSPLFWALIADNGKQNKGGPRAKPKFDVVNGQIRARDNKTNINQVINSAVQRYASDWNGEAAQYNQIANAVGGDGFHYPRQPALFSVPLPDGPPTSISRYQQQLNAFFGGSLGPGAAYPGPVPATAFFNINTFTTQAYAFTLKVGQLDPKTWNMSVFPPIDSTKVGNGSSSFISGDYSGFGQTPFPLESPSII